MKIANLATLSSAFLSLASASFAVESKPVLQFLTGSKDEFYCRDAGLVEIQARHNDGTQSHVVLVDSRRQMGSQYADIRDGSWGYELTTGYRKTSRSRATMLTAEDGALKMKESREKRGWYKELAQYNISGPTNNSDARIELKTQGTGKEPAPYYFATDYQTWGGNKDLGRSIDFQVGATTEMAVNERSLEGAPEFHVKRTVVKHLPEYSVTDSEGDSTRYSDCYQVHYDISSL